MWNVLRRDFLVLQPREETMIQWVKDWEHKRSWLCSPLSLKILLQISWEPQFFNYLHDDKFGEHLKGMIKGAILNKGHKLIKAVRFQDRGEMTYVFPNKRSAEIFSMGRTPCFSPYSFLEMAVYFLHKYVCMYKVTQQSHCTHNIENFYGVWQSWKLLKGRSYHGKYQATTVTVRVTHPAYNKTHG